LRPTGLGPEALSVVVMVNTRRMGPPQLSDFGSRMGAARLGQAASDTVIVTLPRPLTWAKAVTWGAWLVVR
jgi:hypothetical protein